MKKIISILLLAAACVLPASAQVTNQAGTIGYDLGNSGTLPGTPVTVTNSATNTITGKVIINLAGATNITILAAGASSTNSASVSAGVVTYVFAGSIDGTNWTTRSSTLTLPFTVTGTTNNVIYSNYNVAPFIFFKLATIENPDGTNFIAAPVLQWKANIPRQ